MSRKPITLTCEYCKQTIYEDEEYNRAGEFNPDCHETCLDVHLAKEREEHQKAIAEIRAKETRGEQLTFDELEVIVLEDMRVALRDSMLGLIMGKEPKIPVEEKDPFFKPKNVYASVTIGKLSDKEN